MTYVKFKMFLGRHSGEKVLLCKLMLLACSYRSPMIFKLERYFRGIQNKNRRSELTNLRHGYPKWPPESFPWHTALLLSQIFYFFFSDQLSLSLSLSLSLCFSHTHTHTQISDTVQTAYELHLLPNNTVNEIFLLKSAAVRSVDWIFVTGIPAWR
jgi:hypothetical protein